jgi:hypothetical protein
MDRDAQFHYINDQALVFLTAGDPVISVDTKKKELVGDFKNQGREWRPKGTPEAVQVHDFIDPKLGRAVPYGVYDLADNKGWVSVGTDHDTASFAVHAIKRWWRTMGRARYPKATRLLITADGGGSNGYRVRLWKIELQTLANSLRIPITVCHLPPGTSKWNKIEHRLFSFITLNRQAPAQLQNHCPAYRRHDHENRPEGARRIGRAQISERRENIRCEPCGHQPPLPRIPR